MNFQSFCFFQTASTLRVFDAWHPTSHWQAEKEWKWDFKPTFGLFWNGSKRGRERVGQAVRPGKNFHKFFLNKITIFLFCSSDAKNQSWMYEYWICLLYLRFAIWREIHPGCSFLFQIATHYRIKHRKFSIRKFRIKYCHLIS